MIQGMLYGLHGKKQGARSCRGCSHLQLFINAAAERSRQAVHCCEIQVIGPQIAASLVGFLQQGFQQILLHVSVKEQAKL